MLVGFRAVYFGTSVESAEHNEYHEQLFEKSSHGHKIYLASIVGAMKQLPRVGEHGVARLTNSQSVNSSLPHPSPQPYSTRS